MNALELRRRVLMMAQKKSRLPSAYQEVEYLESTGTQYIDTGILASQIGLVKIDQQFRNLNVRQEHGCTVYRVGSRNQSYNFRYLNEFVIQFDDGGSNTFFGFADYLRHEWIADLISDSCQIGQLKKENCKFTEWTNPIVYTFHLFARKENISGNVAINRYCFCKMFSSAFYNKTLTQIGDFVPCYRKSDNKPGMYDLVTKQFFTNQGTGEFIVGADVN